MSKSTVARGGDWNFCVDLHGPGEAVCSRDNPARRHQRAPTHVPTPLLQADLPGPVFDEGVGAPHDSLLGASLPAICGTENNLY